MFKVKYYNRDKFLGEDIFPNLKNAEIGLYRSPYSFVGDYYEIVDMSTDKIVREFIIPTYDLPLFEDSDKYHAHKPEGMDWFDCLEREN